MKCWPESDTEDRDVGWRKCWNLILKEGALKGSWESQESADMTIIGSEEKDVDDKY